MKPGTVFGVASRTIQRGDWIAITPPGAYVVLDQFREVEFWTGAITGFGDIVPSVDFEVLS